MTDLTTNAYCQPYGKNIWTEMIPMNGGTAITGYKGQPLMFDASTDTNSAVPFTSSITVASGDVFVGIAATPFTVLAADADDAVEVLCWRGPTEIAFVSSVCVVADLGKDVYMDDSATLTLTSTNNLKIGKLTRVETGINVVQLSAPLVQ